ncbi:hypothetical protein Pmar_PMAR024385 [Perkinsus marinus ATCC 50983]|uniref:Uncharacterized protein n=1 Tax=Perkinsus marinus (strain ATCC 50983 / TXsc) TaxID=423536 RepID=C5KLY3_PERM5|nr:hypothetical protein Pmar_PMAR024385 [Perkinsus marinus ATCC 50983]EER14498.1 hypothetical protein Pmar_PMAR024385 [Perkinsus marinus ATCC 50983]|eukprot:XP_002782703.1 hypothetical protein Pmar_PMAR024385 [Perkinsus marinus ATCC 50983]
MTSSGEYTIQNRVLKEMHRERMARIECHSKKVFVEYGDGNGLWLKELKGKALGTQRWASGDRFAAMVASSGGRYQELKSFLENCVNGVELGCGVGTAGLMLAKVYTRMRMTLTDQPQCISLAEENVSFNNLGDRVTVSAYSWGDSVDTFAADPPDFVVATDVLYHASVFDKFLSSLEAFAGLRLREDHWVDDIPNVSTKVHVDIVCKGNDIPTQDKRGDAASAVGLNFNQSSPNCEAPVV